MSIRQHTDPVPLAEAITELLSAQDDPFAVRCAWWRLGYAAAEAAHADNYDRGYNDGVLARKRAGVHLYDVLQLEQRRWELWGEKRTRQTFGQPHPNDPRGNGAA